MVGLKQVVTAIVALSLAECTVATPNTGIVEERGLRGLEARADAKFRNSIKKDPSKALRPVNGIGSPTVAKGSFQRSRGRPKQRSLEVRRGGKNRAYVWANKGKIADRVFAGTGALKDGVDMVQSLVGQGQPKQRSLDDDLEERAFEDYIMERYYS